MDKLDLSNPAHQNFSLPLPFIHYIFESDFSLRTFENLIQSCKIIKLWQLQTPGCIRIKILRFGISFMGLSEELPYQEFSISTYNHGITFVDKKYIGNKYFEKLIRQIGDTKLKVMDSFVMFWIPAPLKAILFPKVDVSRIKKISFSCNFEMTFCEYSNLIQSCIEYIQMTAKFAKDFNPVLFAYENCPKLKIITIVELNREETVLTKDEFRKLLNYQQKMKVCMFSAVQEIDPMDFVQFVDTMLEEDGGRISLTFINLQQYNILKDYIQDISKSRELERLTYRRGCLHYYHEWRTIYHFDL